MIDGGVFIAIGVIVGVASVFGIIYYFYATRNKRTFFRLTERHDGETTYQIQRDMGNDLINQMPYDEGREQD